MIGIGRNIPLQYDVKKTLILQNAENELNNRKKPQKFGILLHPSFRDLSYIKYQRFPPQSKDIYFEKKGYQKNERQIRTAKRELHKKELRIENKANKKFRFD